ncbi:MAG: 5-(carboxyamino)imidazole ribonucleotide mutase [Candidatus Thermoplasmatota archaeon]|jgi:5-(carboxyamino)imidazole ribonucleotide mutase|nr:5-(carboxyamino)imidazole ribonucleotide mutase [Candidatus Thermoplasmatota archaeon]
MSKVAVIMGSANDLEVMKDAISTLKELGIETVVGVYSAHRSPEMMLDFCRRIPETGIDVVIAGAGGAAALPGMVAALTEIPVIGIPILGKSMNGLDSLLSIAQMPPGVPVATMGVNAAKNAALLAGRIIARYDSAVSQKMSEFILKQKKQAAEKKLDV